MKTLFVKFDNSYSCKEYQFLTDDMRIEVGDRITSPDYSNPMTVVRVLNSCNKYNSKGTLNKVLRIGWLNGRPYEWKDINELPGLLPSNLEQARGWFNYGGEFRERALKVYSIEELIYCKNDVGNADIKELRISMNRLSKRILSAEALIRAMEIKEDLGKTPLGNYTIIKTTHPEYIVNAECTLTKGFYIVKHQGIKYPGLIYFKSVMSAARVYYDVPELFEYLAQLTNWES
jgi:hypothetical protein